MRTPEQGLIVVCSDNKVHLAIAMPSCYISIVIFKVKFSAFAYRNFCIHFLPFFTLPWIGLSCHQNAFVKRMRQHLVPTAFCKYLRWLISFYYYIVIITKMQCSAGNTCVNMMWQLGLMFIIGTINASNINA